MSRFSDFRLLAAALIAPPVSAEGSRNSGVLDRARFRLAASVAGVTPPRTGYEGAAQGRRLGYWNPGNRSMNEILRHDARLLRERARDASRNNAFADGPITRMVNQIIGTGIVPRSLHKDEATRAAIMKAWRRWVPYADAHGMQDLYGVQTAVARELLVGGEVFVRNRPRYPEDGLPVPVQFQVLSAEHCPLDYEEDLPNGNKIRASIEFDRIGRRVAYWMLREHPGERPLFWSATERVRVPASEVAHIYVIKEPGQIRGVTALASALVKLKDLDEYDDAELMRKKVSAMLMGFITRPAPEDDTEGQETDPAPVMPMQPATMQELLPGEGIEFTDPKDVGGQYEQFMRQQMLYVATALGSTYEHVSSDYSKVTYLSARAALLDFRRSIERIQHQVIGHMLCRFIWSRWFDQAVLSGAIPVSPRELLRNREDVTDVRWVPPGWDWIDPGKDAEANIALVRAGFTSRTEVVAERGYDIEEVDREIAAEQQRADQAGLKFDSDGRNARSGAQAKPPEPNSEATPADEPRQDQKRKGAA